MAGIGRTLAGAVAAIAVLLLVQAGPAAAETIFCPPGDGAGECVDPQGVAANLETDRVYVADAESHRISVFETQDEGAGWEFLFAFGRGVATGAAEWQKCTITCQAGSPGSGAGQFNSPRWIAVDNSVGSANRGDVYVTDWRNHRVNHFDADGNFVNAFGWGVRTGAAALQTCDTGTGCLQGIAPPFISQQLAGECQLGGITEPVAVGPDGSVFVAVTTGPEGGFTGKVEKFSPQGACLGETQLWGQQRLRAMILAVDSDEDAYVSVGLNGGEALRKYALGGAPDEPPLCVPEAFQTTALGLDESGGLFAAQRMSGVFSGDHKVITEFDDACNPIRRFGYGKLTASSMGVSAFPTAEGDVLVGQPSVGANPQTGVIFLASGGPGPVVAPTSLRAPAAAIGNAQAEVQGEINPEGEATSVRFFYVTEAAYEEDVESGGDGFEGPETVESETFELENDDFNLGGFQAPIGCASATPQLIEEGKCLLPETTYRWKVAATNASGVDEAEGEPFTTREPFEILSTFASAVGTETARLEAVIDPVGIPASGFFEYVEQSSWEETGFATATRVPVSGELNFGGGKGASKRSATIAGLEEGATYRFRLQATDVLVEGHRSGEERAFTTYRKALADTSCFNTPVRLGAASLLPDCRGYEMVSPLDKDNGDIIPQRQMLTNLPAAINLSSGSGDRFTYGSYRALGDAKAAPWTSQYLAARGAGGWLTHNITPPRSEVMQSTITNFEFQAFSADLCDGWVVPNGDPPLAPGASSGHRNLYQRTDQVCGGEDYVALSSGEPENLTRYFNIETQGVSADGETVAFVANDSLAGSGAGPQPPTCGDGNYSQCRQQLYVAEPGAGPRFACILPGGAKSKGCQAGTGGRGFGLNRFANLTNALSEDGAKLYFTDAVEQGRIYLRLNPLGEEAECSGEGAPCTVAVSKAAETAEGTTASNFWAAASDGSAAFFTTGSLFSGHAALYRYDLGEGKATRVAGSVYGLVGAGDEGTRVYFASGEDLGAGDARVNSEGDEPVAGQPNLYLFDVGGGIRFVATLAAADVVSEPNLGIEVTSATSLWPNTRNGRVAESGLQAAFVSEASLTGYDNTDASSTLNCGEAGGICDNEVFLYDASAREGKGEIVCVSCNPSGSRPRGANLSPSGSFWAAARLPFPPSSLYDGNLFSEDGERLFFEAQDSLVPRDTNGRLDVYQWARPGKGGCAQEDPTYAAEAGGCIELISSGQSVRDSELLGASASGNDVFFATLSSLYPADYGLVDVYDARVGGGFPPPPEPAPRCEGEACQSPPPAPSAALPPSASYFGPGNLAEPKNQRKGCPKGKRKVKQRGKVRCVKQRGKKAKKAKKTKRDSKRSTYVAGGDNR